MVILNSEDQKPTDPTKHPDFHDNAKPRRRLTPLKVYTDGGIPSEVSAEEIIFYNSDSHRKKKPTGGAVIIGAIAEQIFSVVIPDDMYENPTPYDIEVVTMFTMIQHIGEEVYAATFYTDNEALTKTMNQRPESNSFPDDPLIKTIR